MLSFLVGGCGEWGSFILKTVRSRVLREESDQSGPSTSKRNKKESIPLGEMICYICEKSDKTDNLHAAGVMHATTNTVDKQHVKDSTKKIKEMASYLDLRHAVAKLSSGEIVSNELYYRGHCYKQMCNDFGKKKNEESRKEGFKQKVREDYINAHPCSRRYIIEQRERC